ncbi:MAG TPA: UbiA family prenyltransferase [Candidatus Nanoarchaeia archaeon]|nr:UbiA family prenyltransferase [Candidatus Nanoarchaeia archaeon]
MNTLFRLLRVQQWYKNIILFIPLVFSLNLFHTELLLKYVIGFFSLAFVSSSYYIINDIIDRNRDKLHPEKKHRPIAAGKVSVGLASFVSFLCLTLAVYLATFINLPFLYTVLFMFVYILAYSLFLKHEAFVDILVVAFNFVIRTIAGIFILEVNFISPWIISCTFFLALLVLAGKRRAELTTLKQEASSHRKTLQIYTSQTLDVLLGVSMSFLLLAFALYSVLNDRELLLMSMPVTVYILLHYLNAVYTSNAQARNPELFLRDWRILVSLFLWFILIVLALYL